MGWFFLWWEFGKDKVYYLAQTIFTLSFPYCLPNALLKTQKKRLYANFQLVHLCFIVIYQEEEKSNIYYPSRVNFSIKDKFLL